jgi:TP901 family phage tail tape measure protein
MASREFRSAAASTGMFEVQQLRVNKATEDYVKAINKQQLSFKKMAAQRKVAQAAYREQLAMQQMMVSQSSTSTIHGRSVADTVTPNIIGANANKAAHELSFFSQELKSGSRQLVNWGKNTQWAGRQLMVGFTLPLAAAGAAAGVMAYRVDEQLTRIAKVYDTTADQNNKSMESQMAVQREFDKLRSDGMKTAMTAAKEYGASATDTLNVQAELAATGKKGEALQKSTVQVMKIARLGELDYNDAIKATISLQSVFRQSTKELGDSFNFMNSIENSTSLQTKDFAQAIPIAANTVKEFGGDIKDLGILLTAMKERGIEATQGANAIKAAMQRLGRPSKQVQEEWTTLTGTDITKIFDESTSLIDLFSRINEATKELTNKDRIKAFAGLFGTYQVTRMSALVQGMDDLKNGVGQVSKAYKIAESSSKSWANTADQEIKQYQKSISGRFKNALETMKVQLAQFGKPFVEVATVVVKAISKIIEFLNGMPKPIKMVGALGVAFLALAGPIIMITGLVANMTGSVLGGVGALLAKVAQLSGGMKVQTTQEKAAEMIANEHTTAILHQVDATEMLVKSINAYRQSMIAANKPLRQQTFNALVAGGMSPTAAMAKMDREYAESMAAMNVQSSKAAEFTKGINKESEPIKRNWKAIGTNTALAAGGLALFFMDSKGAVGQFAKLVFYAALLGPLLTPLGPLMKKFGVMMGLTTEGIAARTAAIKASSGAMVTNFKAAPGFLAKTKMAGKGVLSVITGIVGKTGLWLAGAAAVGYALYKLVEWRKSAAAEEERQQQAILSNSNLMNDALDIRIRKQKELNLITPQGPYKPGEATPNDIAGGLKKSGSGQALIASYQNADEPTKNMILMRKYAQILNSVGGNAKKATTYVQGLMLAADDDASKAASQAQSLADAMGTAIDKTEQLNIWRQMIDTTLTTNDIDTIKSRAGTIGKELYGALAQAVSQGKGGGGQGMVTNLGDQFAAQLNDAMAQVSPSITEALANAGVKGVAQIRQALDDLNSMNSGGMSTNSFASKYGLDPNSTGFNMFISNLQQAQSQTYLTVTKIKAAEAGVAQELANQMHIQGTFNTLKELEANQTYKLLTYTKAQAKADFVRQRMQLQSIDDNLQLVGLAGNWTNTLKLAQLNTWRVALGMKETGTLLDGFGRATVDVNGNLIDWGHSIDSANSKLSRSASLAQTAASAFNGLTRANFMSAYQSGMQGVQQSIADDYSAAIDKRMQAALDSRQAYWDKRNDQLSAELDRKGNALDAKWEKKKDAAQQYWDNRVKSVENAIDAESKANDLRQKMFEAEIARINKLNEAANRNIDFNTALSTGNFDEAAKIRNDATAADAQSMLEKAAESGSRKSQRRVDRLNKKKDRISNAAEKAMKAMDKQEAAEKAHLERVSKMRQDALARDQKASMDALQAEQDARKASLDKQMDLFMAFIAGNKKQLKEHMDQVGISYEMFGKDVLDKRGLTYSQYFSGHLKDSMSTAIAQIASDSMWTKLGQDSAKMLLQGIGFKNMQEFRKFARTGVLPPGAGGGGGGKGGGKTNPGGNAGHSSNDMSEWRHKGGVVGEGMGSRYGVARGMKGMHPSEKMITAQKGEFVVNRKATSQNREMLENINKGYGVGGMTYPGLAGFMSAAINKMLAGGVTKAMGNAYAKMVARNAMNFATGLFGAAAPGKYGDNFFDASQLKNAKTIANVGKSMGMSGRDIEIGIMTAITESGLRNVNYGDRDSLGLFQQRPSMGWGTPQQVTNPEYAARKFFSVLKGVTGRSGMDPWLAAQSVQRSAYSDGSNYRPNWNEAIAIFGALGRQGKGAAGAALKQGKGGRHRPVPHGYGLTQGVHDAYTGFPAVDFGVPVGTRVMSAADGRVTGSYDIRGFEPRNSVQNGYRSYGRVITVDHGGFKTLYAHLNNRYAKTGQSVKGGTVIGKSGNTGHSTGPHLHFGAQGVSPMSFVSLQKGTPHVKYDNTIANLHHGEAVLTKEYNRKFHQGIDNFANGGNNQYDIDITIDGGSHSADEIARKVMREIERREGRKPRGRKE